MIVVGEVTVVLREGCDDKLNEVREYLRIMFSGAKVDVVPHPKPGGPQ